MPKYNVFCRVQRTIIQTKEVDIEVEADSEDAAEDLARDEAERGKYHNLEEMEWDLDEINSEMFEVIEITPIDEGAE